MNGIGTDDAENEDRRNQDGVGQTGDLRKTAAAQKTDTQHEELHEHKPREERVGHPRVRRKEFGPRLQTVNDKAAHQHGRHAFTGNAERQGRNEGAPGNSIVGSFGTRHTFYGALTEIFLMFGKAPCFVVPHEARNGSACSGENPHHVTDHPTAEDRRKREL